MQPDALADLVVINTSSGRVDPFDTIVAATEMDVDLVMVGGKPLCGTPALMANAGATGTSQLDVRHERRALALTHFDTGAAWSFADVLARMAEVRADPKKEIEAARRNALAGLAGGGPPAFRLALDMPTGRAPVGGLPRDLSKIVVPPIQPIAHDAAFFDALVGRGFHGGLLNGLRAYYDV